MTGFCPTCIHTFRLVSLCESNIGNKHGAFHTELCSVYVCLFTYLDKYIMPLAKSKLTHNHLNFTKGNYIWGLLIQEENTIKLMVMYIFA